MAVGKKTRHVEARPAPLPRDLLALPSVGTITQAFLGVLLVGFVVLLVVVLSNVVTTFLLAVFLATIIDPSVQALRRRGMPVSIGILLHYAVFFACALFLALSLVPILAEQVTELSSLSTSQVNGFLAHPTISIPLLQPSMNDRLSHLLETAFRQEAIQQFPDALQRFAGYLSAIGGGSLRFATGVVGSVLTFFIDLTIILTLTFFLELERDRVIAWLLQALPPHWRPYTHKKLGMMHRKIAQWAKGQVLLCICIGILVFIMLLILRVHYALTLALLAAFTEFIPYVGPLIAAIPGILIGAVQGGLIWGLIVAAAYYIVQWSENNIIVPLIMRHAVDISPVAIIFAMLVGISFPSILHPVLGILVSIPLTSIIGIFLDDFRHTKPSHHSPAAA